MAITNQERIGKAMELLRAELAPFVEHPLLGKKPIAQWDAAGLLKLMWELRRLTIDEQVRGASTPPNELPSAARTSNHPPVPSRQVEEFDPAAGGGS